MPNSARGRRILVTGAAGFAGHWLREAMRTRLAASDQVVFTSLEQQTERSFGSRQLDVTNAEVAAQVVAEISPTTILHLAAISNVPQARNDPWRSWEVNLRGTFNLARAIIQSAPRARFIFVGTSEVYGEQFNRYTGPIGETVPLAPTNTYGSSKAAADLLIGQMAHEGLQAVRVRPFNHTGPRQTEQFAIPAFAAQIARIERGEQEPVIRVGNLDARRDFTDVRDIVDAYVTLLTTEQALEPGLVLNLASGTARRIGDVLEDLLSHAKVAIKVEQDPARLRPNDTPVACGNASRAAALIGWRPTRNWSDTLADTLNYWRQP